MTEKPIIKNISTSIESLPTPLKPKSIDVPIINTEPGVPAQPQPVGNVFRGIVAPIASKALEFSLVPFLESKKKFKTAEAVREGAPTLLDGVCYFGDKYLPVGSGLVPEEVEALKKITEGVTKIITAYYSEEVSKNGSINTGEDGSASKSDFTDFTKLKPDTSSSSSDNKE
jgi:hypothetical protein